MNRIAISLCAALLLSTAASVPVLGQNRTYFVAGAPGADEPEGPIISRTIPWDGAQRLSINVSSQVTFTQGPAPSISVTGPQNVVEQIEATGERIGLTRNKSLTWHTPVQIRITAPRVDSFQINASTTLALNGVKTPTLSLFASSSSRVTGDVDVDTLHLNASSTASAKLGGRADQAHVAVSSVGYLNLRDLKIKDATIDASSQGYVLAAPVGTVVVRASTAGGVRLLTRPASVSQQSSTGGYVRFGEAPAKT